MTMTMTMTMTMDVHNPPRRKPPRRRDDRVILHFDLDCFYAQCIENQQPHLKSRPLGIKQKSILATCNYEARRRGVKKLMPIYEARKICPDLVLADVEDLTLFRDVSKRLYSLLRSYSWSGKIERLGLDEVFMDVTDIVTYNVDLLNKNDLRNSWFCLDRDDPTKGFELDATQVAGCVYGEPPIQEDTPNNEKNALYTRLILASHLALHLRQQIEQTGFTTSAGISTNKTLAKLVGSKNKPRNQTTLLTTALPEDAATLSFMDEHNLRSIPGIGNRITSLLEAFIHDHDLNPDSPRSTESSLTVDQVRTHPLISPPSLEKLLVTPGAEKNLGLKIWSLLHGVDDTPVKQGRDVPTQISIEDTYKGLNEPAEINRELTAIASSLLRRMRVDLVDPTTPTSTEGSSGTLKWMAYPRTIRLTTRPYSSPAENKPYSWARTSRSGPLPSFVFNNHSSGAMEDSEVIVEKLVIETLIPMFKKLNPAPRGWNIGLINICVANMSGSDAGVAGGRDIGDMFRRQEDVLREFRVYEHEHDEDEDEDAARGDSSDGTMTAREAIGVMAQRQPVNVEVKEDLKDDIVNVQVSPVPVPVPAPAPETIPLEKDEGHGDTMDANDDNGRRYYYEVDDDDEPWDLDLDPDPVEEDQDQDQDQEHQDTGNSMGMDMDNMGNGKQCPLCGHFIPFFALTAHARFHSLEGV